MLLLACGKGSKPSSNPPVDNNSGLTDVELHGAETESYKVGGRVSGLGTPGREQRSHSVRHHVETAGHYLVASVLSANLSKQE